MTRILFMLQLIARAFEHACACAYPRVCVCVCVNEFEFQRLRKVRWTSECTLKFAVRFTNCTRMSAEPGRKAPYSNDIRWHVVWQRIGMEL